jgi:ATP-dependent DNA ligase
MSKQFEFCRPAAKKVVPSGPDWIHEVKYDGYRGCVVRDGKDVRLFSKAGFDWTWRFPCIVETALKLRQQRFVIDGEICVLDVLMAELSKTIAAVCGGRQRDRARR